MWSSAPSSAEGAHRIFRLAPGAACVNILSDSFTMSFGCPLVKNDKETSVFELLLLRACVCVCFRWDVSTNVYEI